MANKSKVLTFGSACKGSVGGSSMLIMSESLKAEYTWHEPTETGLVGTAKPQNLGRQVVKKDVKGQVGVQPSYVHLNTIMEKCFNEASSNTFTPHTAVTSTDIDIVLDRSVDVYTYESCWVSNVTIDSRENEPVLVTLDLLGQDETNEGEVSDLTLTDRVLNSDLTVAINSNTYFPMSAKWMFDYRPTERFHQSTTRSTVGHGIPECKVELEMDMNSDNWADLFALAGTDTALSNVILTWTDGDAAFAFTMASMTVISASRTPDTSGVDAVTGTVELKAWSSDGSTDLFSAVYTPA